ncbi:MAG: potassium-transporting ATPase subunit KdpA [Planctomycetaceae bacterium]|nr:potassium-transporting ATPase subunit KdpA [Planctomycetaceae bacterium]
MSWQSLTEVALLVVLLLLLAPPLGRHLARVYAGEPGRIGRWLVPVERALLRGAGVDATRSMGWREYALAMLALQAVGIVALLALQLAQAWLPLNARGLPAVPWHVALNTAVSFVTNTNWQSYSGEVLLGHLVQLLGLTVQNFVSAATGMAVLAALLRALEPEPREGLGNFWVDLVRGVVHVLLPLSLVLAVALLSQGVVQTLASSMSNAWIDPALAGTVQESALGPVASQVAIKQLGTNGGGFFGVNSAHPFENPTPLSNFLELLAILLLPAAACFQLASSVRRPAHGRALLAAMFALFLPLALFAMRVESGSSPAFGGAPVDAQASELQSGGNMEGKETRLGPGESALWAAATTATSSGSVNAMHDSFLPLGGLVPMFLMQLGEVAFGGVGSGLYGMVLFALVAVFLAGLMVGRTPEYLGKKLGAFEMQMTSVAILLPSVAVLIGTALVVATQAGRSSLQEHGAHGFSEALYAFSSAGNNNGSAFGGFDGARPLADVLLALAMLVGRYGVALPVLALAGSLAKKRAVPPSPGTLPDGGVSFVVLLVGVIVLVGALNFVPALALGPVAEQMGSSVHGR